MEPQEDAYGNIIEDIHTGENSQAGEIIERDDGFIEAPGSAKYLFEEYEDWSDEVQEVMGDVKGKVVDVGCGAGRHSLYLQSNGYDVMGIDVSPKAVEVSRDRGVRKTGVNSIDGLQDQGWDTVLMLGNNLGLLGTRPVSRLNHLASCTSEDGIIIGQIGQATETSNLYHKQYHKYNEARGRRPGCLRIRIRYQLYQTDWFNYLCLDKNELRNILSQTNWIISKMYDDDSNYIVVLEKNQK